MEPFETEIHLKDYLRIIQKRRWLILSVFVVLVTVVTVRSFRQRPFYRASAQLLIETRNPEVLGFKEVMELDARWGAEDYYQTQYKILRSRALAYAVVDRLGLEEHPEMLFHPSRPSLTGRLIGWVYSVLSLLTPDGDEEASVDGALPASTGGPAEERVNPRRAALASAVLGKVSIQPVRDTQLVNVVVTDYSPLTTATIANALSEVYIEESLKHRIDTTRRAGEWLGEQMQEARAKLEKSERTLQAYKEANNIVSIEERQNFIVQKLEELNTALIRARTGRIELETRYRQMKRIIEEGGTRSAELDSLPEVLNNQLVQSLKKELSNLQGRLSELSKVYTPKHPKIVGINSQIETLRGRIDDEVDKVAQSIRSEYEVARNREESLGSAVEDQKRQIQEFSQKSIEYGVLKREVDNNRRIFQVLISRQKETDLEKGLRTSNIRLVDRAEVPLGPAGPRRLRNVALAMIVGLMAGVGLAFFLEYLDDSVRDPDDLERYLQIPFLGPIPLLEPKEDGPRSRDLITLREPKSICAEAYRAVRTSLLFSSPDDPPVVIAVTSPGPQEGKTVTAVNLALTMAAAGSRVLLLDADMRKPRAHRIFGLDNTMGLSTLLGGENEVGPALKKTRVPTLSVMTSGPIPPNPSELLGTRRMEKLLALLKGRFDRVVLDCTPLISVTDATVLSARADGVILVVKAGATGRKILQRGKKQLEDVNARIIGAVLNWVDVRKSTYYYSPYYYYHYYGEDNGRQRARTDRKAKDRLTPAG